MTSLALTSRLCPLCGSRGTSELFSEAKIDEAALTSFAFASRKLPEYMHHRLVRCLRCDIVYANPAPAPEDLANEYQNAAYDSRDEARMASRLYGTLVDAIIAKLPGRRGALDIGTGDGSFLSELLQRGFIEVGGVEPSAAPIEQADVDVRALIHHGVFTKDIREPSSLSLVTCFQTIEHVPDPLDMCREAIRLLRPGGALMLVGHNRRALSARVLRERSPIFDVEHLQLFSPRSARIMLERAGLTGVTVRPVINRYPISYWTRLFPLPASVKEPVMRLMQHRLGRVMLPLPAGNMVAYGFRAA